ncbi:MAG: DUF2306 domain-containing protein [Crocinitomicaceae bacterium]|nr:DUF2306 domain-containing protein [Crocinitomicaceae bacterium]
MARMIQRIQFSIWLLMAMLAMILFVITASYLSFKSDVNFLLVKQDIVNDPIWRPTFYIHVISGMLVILVGPFQFLKSFRAKFLNWHKLGGKIYAYSILLLAAPTGLIMAFYAQGGLWSTVAFSIMSILWFVTTLMAVIKIKQRKIEEHKMWMMRSYALSFAAVTLRLLVPLFSLFILDNEDLITVSTAWLSWMLNLLVAEGMIFAIQQKHKRAAYAQNPN